MPSIPQSLLWISLVVLWLFVLVPMLINKRDTVRRTSDVALATRVLTSGAAARLLRRSGPATGHRSDPHWRSAAGADDELDDDSPSGSVLVVAEPDEDLDSGYLDVDVVDEDSGALPVGSVAAAADVAEAEPEYPAEEPGDGDETDTGPAADAGADEYEYVEDTSGLEAEDEEGADESPLTVSTFAGASRRRRYDTSTAAAVTARKYAFRKRVLMAMALVLVLSATMAFTVTETAWWLCGTTTGVTVLYLAYLRRQTRIEEQVRARRMRRMARARRDVEYAGEHEVDVTESRLHRPGSVVLEIDDEDPAFEHLGYASFARDYDWRGDLPRAAGQ